MRAQLQGKAPRENHHLGLRCRVECIARQRGADRRDRGQIDDAPVAPRPHAPDHGARGMDHALHVYSAHARDLLPVVGVQRALPSHASVVHQDGHRTQLCFSAGDHRLDRGRLGDVCRHRDSSSARGRNFGDHRLGRIGMHGIVHAHGGTTLRQKPRRCSAEAAGAARHHRHLVAPFHHVPFHGPDQHAGQLFYRDTARAGGGTALQQQTRSPCPSSHTSRIASDRRTFLSAIRSGFTGSWRT